MFWHTKKDEQLTPKLDPWTLACAVGAMNGSIYGAIGSPGVINFENWLELVKKDDWESRTGESLSRVSEALRRYAQANRNRHMEEVLHAELALRRGERRGVLGAESRTRFTRVL